MRVLSVNDGTVPVIVARVIAQDGDDESLEQIGVGIGYHNSDDLDVRVADIDDDSVYLGISWFDGDGFNYVGFKTWVSAFEWMCEDDGMGTDGPHQVAPGHYNITINPGDNEGYCHVFKL
jgi:hypothetical protein